MVVIMCAVVMCAVVLLCSGEDTAGGILSLGQTQAGLHKLELHQLPIWILFAGRYVVVDVVLLGRWGLGLLSRLSCG